MTMQGTEQFASDFSRLETQEELPAGQQAPIELGGGEEQVTEETTQAPVNTPEGENNQENNEGGEGDEPLTVIDQLRSQYGIEDVLENEVEGIQTLIEKVKEKAQAEGITQKFTEKPVLAELDKHLDAGKSLESFFQVRSVEAGKLQEVPLTGDETQQAKVKAYYKDVIKANLAEKGLAERQISRILESSELEETIEEDYKEALTEWNGRRDQEASQIDAQEEARVLKEQQDAIETVKEINTLVDAGTIGNAIIPAAERAEFKKFLLEQDAQGMSARDRKLQQLGLDKNLLIDYLVFKDFNIKGLVQAPSKRQALADLNKNRPDRMAGEGSQGNSADQTRLPESIANMNFSGLHTQQTL